MTPALWQMHWQLVRLAKGAISAWEQYLRSQADDSTLHLVPRHRHRDRNNQTQPTPPSSELKENA